MCRPVYLSTCLPADQNTCKSMCFYQFVDLSTCPPVYLPTKDMLKVAFTNLSMCRAVYLSTCLPVHHVHVKEKKMYLKKATVHLPIMFISIKDKFLFLYI